MAKGVVQPLLAWWLEPPWKMYQRLKCSGLHQSTLLGGLTHTPCFTWVIAVLPASSSQVPASLVLTDFAAEQPVFNRKPVLFQKQALQEKSSFVKKKKKNDNDNSSNHNNKNDKNPQLKNKKHDDQNKNDSKNNSVYSTPWKKIKMDSLKKDCSTLFLASRKEKPNPFPHPQQTGGDPFSFSMSESLKDPEAFPTWEVGSVSGGLLAIAERGLWDWPCPFDTPVYCNHVRKGEDVSNVYQHPPRGCHWKPLTYQQTTRNNLLEGAGICVYVFG